MPFNRWQTGILAADQLAKLTKNVRLQSIMELSTLTPSSNSSFASEASKHAKSPRNVGQSTPSDKDRRKIKNRTAQIEAVISKVSQKNLASAGTQFLFDSTSVSIKLSMATIGIPLMWNCTNEI